MQYGILITQHNPDWTGLIEILRYSGNVAFVNQEKRSFILLCPSKADGKEWQRQNHARLCTMLRPGTVEKVKIKDGLVSPNQ